MISDRYILSHESSDIEKNLDVVEHMSACYGFERQDIAKLRLLAEEMIFAVRSALVMNPGEMWFETKDGMFSVLISCSSDIRGMSEEEKKEFLKMDNVSKKGGLFTPIKNFFTETLNAYGVGGGYIAGDFSHFMGGVPGFDWNEGAAYWYPQIIDKSEEKETEDHSLSISLIQAFADGIRVKNHGDCIEMSIIKEIPQSHMQIKYTTR